MVFQLQGIYSYILNPIFGGEFAVGWHGPSPALHEAFPLKKGSAWFVPVVIVQISRSGSVNARPEGEGEVFTSKAARALLYGWAAR